MKDFFKIVGMVALVGFIITMAGLSIRREIKQKKTQAAKIEHLIEIAEDAKEERHLYRDLAMLLYSQQTDESEAEAYTVIDNWMKLNRDCVKIQIGLPTVTWDRKTKKFHIRIDLDKVK